MSFKVLLLQLSLCFRGTQSSWGKNVSMSLPDKTVNVWRICFGCFKLSTTSPLPHRTERADSYLWKYSHIVDHSIFTLSENWQLTAVHTWYSDAFNIYLGTKMWPLQGILLGVEREGLHGIQQGWNQDSSGPECSFIPVPWSCVWISVSKKRGPLNIKKDQHKWLSGHTPAGVGSLNTQLHRGSVRRGLLRFNLVGYTTSLLK